MRKALRLGFAGTPAFAVPALDALAQHHRICVVFTQPDRAAGRGRRVQDGPVKSRALALGLPVQQPQKFNAPEPLKALDNLELDALIVVAYGLLLPPAALSIPKLGCFNIHASLLPRWRGAAPIQRAILAGDARTGVTIMRMEAGLDTGPILASRTIDIDAADSAQTLHDRLAPLGAELMVETLDELAAGRVREQPQSAEGVTYAAKIDKAEASIDWSAPAARIARQVRAFNPWPVAHTEMNGVTLRVLEAQALPEPVGPQSTGVARSARGSGPGAVLAQSAGGIDVECGDGVLRILRLQLAGRRSLTAQEFVRGQSLPARLGA